MRIFFKLSIIFFSIVSLSGLPYPDPDGHHAGRCTGSASCRACKTCNYCGHCNSGGSCGVCSSSQRTVTPQPKPYSKPSGTRSSTPVYTSPISPADEQESPQEEVTEEETAPEGVTYYVNAKLLNVRSYPSTSSKIIYQLEYADEVQVVGIVDDKWNKVRVETSLGDQVTGYVLGSYLTEK